MVAPVFVLAAVLLAVPVAGAVPLSPTENTLPESSFEGGDGNQTVVLPTRSDWETLQPNGRVEHSPDPNAQDDAFKGGSKEDDPGKWDFDIEAGGVNPSKANILDAWSSVDEVGANTFLYLAFARAASGGSTSLTFELNRDSRLWNNGRADIPCRLDGDLLITFEPQGNGVSVSVETWTTKTTDPATGCAETGSLHDANVSANVDIQGAMNAATITNSLPGTLGTIPAEQFGETALNLGNVLASARGTPCGAFTSFWMHSRSSDSGNSNMQDYVAPHEIDARRCAAAGTKWHDNNADGERDVGDLGLAGFRIYADLNDNRRYDEGEPFAITDKHGDYVIDDTRLTGTYTLREQRRRTIPPSGPWLCSHPRRCSWTVNAATEPYAKRRDFGNWRPARLTLTKQLVPHDDPGRFNLSGGLPALTVPRARDGTSRTFLVKPDTYTVSESPARGTNAADYTSSVGCSPRSGRTSLTRGTTSKDVTVMSGERVVCTFVNVRQHHRAITIQKGAPEFAQHGDTLQYELIVQNTGDVSFGRAEVRVTDRQCDRRPSRVGVGRDDTPNSLDPGDVWTYACDRTTTPVEPDDCDQKTVHNRATVTAPGARDSDTGTTTLLCPQQPEEPGITIQKVGPSTAEAGTALTYVFYVRNTGQVSFPEAKVTVTDPDCDAPPQRVLRVVRSGRLDTSSPTVLDPGDVWIYVCTNTTPAPGPDCQPSVVTNTGTVVAGSNRATVHDSDSFDTPLTCPPPGPTPPEPTPPQPTPPQPQPETAASTPQERTDLVLPTAGVAGQSALSPLRGCVRRGSRVVISGSRIASITVTIGGRRVGGLRVQSLQRRAIIHVVGNPTPGRYRVTATIRFQRGSGTPTVRLTRTVRVCAAAAQAPAFTG
jgi:prealbumin domain-containing protein